MDGLQPGPLEDLGVKAVGQMHPMSEAPRSVALSPTTPTGVGASVVFTCSVLLTDKGVGDASRGINRQKFRVPNVCFLPKYHLISSSGTRIDKLHKSIQHPIRAHIGQTTLCVDPLEGRGGFPED
jgi:hypothetical protein